jgi:hypothetical protein
VAERALNGFGRAAFHPASRRTLTLQLGVCAQDGLEWFGGSDRNGRSSHYYQDSCSRWHVRPSRVSAGGSWRASLFGYSITDEKILFCCADRIASGLRCPVLRPATNNMHSLLRIGTI